MSKFKLALLLVICMVTMLTPASAEEETAASAPENKYEYEAGVLESIGVLDRKDENLKAEEQLTRAQFVYGVCMALGVGDSTKIRTCYSDVTNSHWASGYIHYMTEVGAIDGSGGEFYPDEPVEYAQALKILTKIAGYDEMAEAKGGYPFGYMLQANDIKLTQGLNISSDAYITNDLFSKLIYNFLRGKIAKFEVKGTNDVYEKVYRDNKNGATILSEYRNIEYDTGIVTANRYTGLKTESGVGSKQLVTIDGDETENYYIGDTDAADYLGYTVDFYYYEYEGDKYLAFIGYREQQNKLLVISSDNFKGCSGRTIKYIDDDNKTHNVTYSTDASLIYNGICRIPYDDSDIDFGGSDGSITLLDSGNNGEYNCIFFEKYDFCVADYVNSADKRIIGKYESKTFDFEDYDDDDVAVYVDGKKRSLDEIYAYDPLYICQNSKCVKIYINSEMVRGTVDSIGDEECMIGGVRYEFSPKINIADDDNKIKADSSGKFYFDIFGKIASFEKSSTAGFNYGVIMKLDVDKNLDEKVYLKIFTKNNEPETFVLAEKVLVNGISKNGCGTSDGGAAEALLGSFPKAVKWSVNSKGEINKVYIPQEESQDPDALELTHKKDLRSYTGAGRFGFHRNGSGNTIGKYAFDMMVNNAVYIQIPKNTVDADNEDCYMTLSPSSLEDTDSEVTVEGYDADDMNEVALCLEYGDGGSGGKPVSNWNTIYPVAIKKIFMGVNSENEPCKLIEFTNGKTYPVKSEYTEAANFQKGDFVKYQLDREEIFALKKFVDIKSVMPDDLITGGKSAICPAWVETYNVSNPSRTDMGIARTIYGIPWKVSGNKMVLAKNVGMDENGVEIPIAAEMSVNITSGLCVCEITGGDSPDRTLKVRTGTMQDLQDSVYEISKGKAKLFNTSTYGYTRAGYLIIFKD